MAIAAVIGIAVLVLGGQPARAIGGQERVAYYGNWDMYGNSYFLKDVDTTGAASRLTTLIYSFENISPTTLKCFQGIHATDTGPNGESNPNAGDGGSDAWADYQAPFSAQNSVNGHADVSNQPLRGNFNQLKQLKAKHPGLKIMLSIGGWTFSKYFSDAAATPASRAALVSSCLDLYIRGNLPTNLAGDTSAGGMGVAKNIFDGIDIDWEFPGSTNGHMGNHTSANDTANYTALLAEFRSQLNAQGSADGKYYRLTAAVPSGAQDIAKIQASQIVQYLDWIGVMSYDMHGAWEGSGPTNFQAPLYSSPADPAASSAFTVDQAVHRWMAAGWPANKITVGVPFYWRGWTGVSAGSNHGLYQPATGPSPKFAISNMDGVAHFKELLKAGKLSNTYNDSTTGAPWVYDGNNFYTGDTPLSISQKGNYIRTNGLLGAMVYSLESDDPQGTMLKSVVNGLNGGSAATLPVTAVVTGLARTSLSSTNTATNAEPINMIGGNYLATRHEFTLPNKDVPVDFALNYNSAAAGEPGPVGWGWTHSYRMTALTDIDGSVVVQNPDNRMDRYIPNGSGGFIAPAGLHDALSNNSGSFKLTRANHFVYNFNTQGLLSSIVSPNGNTQTLTYNSNAQLTKITDSVNRNFDLAYDTGSNLLASVTDPSGRIVRYIYNPLGELVEVENAASKITKYEYDASHHITKLTDPRGNAVVVNAYDDQGRVTQQTNGLGDIVTLTYEPGKTIYTDALGGQTLYFYDAGLRLTKQQDALGGITTTTYDTAGNVSQTTDALGRTTTRAYDARNNLTQITDPAGGMQTFTYDAQDNLLTITDQLNHTTTYTYDVNGNVKQRTDPAGNITKVTYDANGQPTAVIDPLNNLTGFVYDAAGNQVTATDASNRNTYYGYDGIGRLTAVENADGNEATYTLDAMDRITKITDPSGNDTTAAYDADGNKTQLTDTNGHATSYQYDANNNLTKTTNALGKATNYTYDKNSNLTKVIDAKSNPKVYTYDLLNRQTQATDPLGAITKIAYDTAGRITQRTDASNRITTYEYDNLDRLIKTTYPDATIATNTYDAVGKLLTAINTAGTTTYTYDNLDRVTAVKDPHNALLTYTYNSANELTQVKYPDNKTVSYTYTPAKQLSTVKDWNNATTTYLYDNEGRVGVKTYPNTIKATYSYDENGNLTDLVYKKGTSALTNYNYERDAVGNVLGDTETKANGTQLYSEYTYDALDQLTMHDAPNNTWAYTYDDVGNMKTSVADGTTTNYTYNAANELLSKGTRNFAYDAQGNEITDGAKTLGYNFDNQLKTYTSGSATTTYVYDATGNRIEKNGATNYQYVNAGNNEVVVAKNISNSTSNFYVYGNDLISQGGPNTSDRQYYLTDGLGNVRYLTNSSGTTLNSYATDAYGSNQTGTGSTANNYMYQAEQKDSESSLTFLRARYYDPTIGRFTSQDPLSGTLEDPASQNGYNYANNNPVNLSDPSGMAPDPRAVLGIMSAPTAAPSTRKAAQTLEKYGPQSINKDLDACNWDGLVVDVAVTGLMFMPGVAEAKTIERGASVSKVENIIFKSDHVAKHLVSGVSQESMEAAIKADLLRTGLKQQYEQRTITFSGKLLEYRAYTLPDGTINVGTYFFKP
jgi:RHS repeat-associated protein